ncbi:MAG: ABC transporter substrate-binding protein, partial [Chloroflexota bacterium]
MRFGKSFIMISCLTVLGVLLAACAPAAAPTPTPKAAAPAAPKAPAATAAPKEAATPAAKPTAAPVAPTPKPTAPTPAPKPAGPTPTSKPTAEQPKKGGVLNRSIRADIPHFDLHTSSSTVYLHPISPAYNGIVQYDPMNPGKIIPDLAEKWTVSQDGLLYTFNIRKGVKWHDGNPLTAEDIRFSLERLKKQAQVGPGMPAVKKIEAPDEQTIKLTLGYPSNGLISHLALAWAAIFPKHVLEKKPDMKRDIVGTGAFKLKKYESGSHIELERNKDYFVPDRPYLDGIRTYFIADEATAIAALKTGRVDFMIFLSDSGAMRVKDTYKQGTAGQFRMGQWRCMYLPVDRAPWTDIRVRKAVHLVIDRQAANKVIVNDIGEIGSVIPEVLGGIPQEEVLKRPGYRQPKDQDIAEAKRLLAEAGYPNGLTTSAVYRKGTEYESQAVFTKEQVAKIGIELVLHTMDDAAFYDVRAKKTYDSLTIRRSLPVNDPDALLFREYKTGAADNFPQVSDKELDRLIELQTREQDPVKR